MHVAVWLRTHGSSYHTMLVVMLALEVAANHVTGLCLHTAGKGYPACLEAVRMQPCIPMRTAAEKCNNNGQAYLLCMTQRSIDSLQGNYL